MTKVVLAISFLVLMGLPVLALWKMLALLVFWLVLACSRLRLSRWRIACALAIVVLTVSVRVLLPGAALEEGHNIFLVTDGENPVSKGLPPVIYDDWRRAFEQQYPPETDPAAAWRKTPPLTLYTASSDALWRPARYSRTVDAVDFRTLSEFRGGFANEGLYNFFGSDAMSMARGFQADLPFFVMYEFSPASLGSTLHWQGTVFWEKTGGAFAEIAHRRLAGRTITIDDIGKKAYALSLPAPLRERPWEHPPSAESQDRPTALAMRLELRPGLVVARYADGLLGLAAVFGILALLTKIDWRPYRVALGVTAASLVILGTAMHFSEGKYLGAAYPPHGGGDDGLSHEGMGRAMARKFMGGHWQEGLRGEQDVYWDTPGMRYFRFTERIAFGETNLGYAALVALLPWFVYLLIQQLAGTRWAFAGTALFLLSPFGSLSFVQYIQNAKLGYAEAAGFAATILGCYLFVRSQPGWGGARSRGLAFLGGACLAGAMFLRPNLALSVVLIGSLFVLASWQQRDFRTVAAAMMGLALALWMPLHNYLYGHQFVLISAAGGTISIPLSPFTYLRAMQEIATGTLRGESLAQVTAQVTGWLGAQPRLPVQSLRMLAGGFLILRLITLALTAFAALRYLRRGSFIPVLAWTALAAHLPMLFVFAAAQFRYAMIAWDLCAIVTLLVVADYWPRLRRISHSSTAQPA